MPLTTKQKDKLIEAAQNAVTFTVEGSGRFPLDMLRYDLCWPSTQADSALLENATGLVGHGTTVRPIVLKGLKLPTTARWASFGWTVTQVVGERVW